VLSAVELEYVVVPYVAVYAFGNATRFGSESVTAPVPADAVIWLAVPASEVTPVLVMTPVAETYEMPVPPLREVEEILLLNVLKSVELRYPLAPVLLWVMVTFPAAKRRGAEYVVVAVH
jgi:hypothetical protein